MRRIWFRLRDKPLERRVTLSTAAAVAVAILLSNLAGYAALRATLLHASQSVAESIARDLAVPAADSLETTGRLDARVSQAGGVVVEAVAADGSVRRVPGETSALVLDPADTRATAPGAGPSVRTGVDDAGTRYLVVTRPLEDTGYALLVARPLGPVLEILSAQRLILLCVCAISIVACALLAGVIARYGLRPVRRLTAAVRHVTDTNDFQPVAMPDVSGELAVLASSFNQLLRSLGEARERQARLVADASHELRTPLTSLTTNVDLLASDLQANYLSAGARAVILGDVRAQLGELNELVGDLVHLTRDDSSAFEPFDIRDVVHSAVDRVRRRSQDRFFLVELDPFYLIGDPAAFERVMVNLLDNAVKWSPTGSTVRVRLQGNRLRVADSGPGIPEADLPFVFDRFFRGETARNTPGTGLGLSIVAKTLEDHGGSVRAGRSDDGGAEFTLQLPGATSPQALPSIMIRTG